MNITFCRAALTPSAPLALMPPPPSGPNQPVTVSRLQMQLHLQSLQQNTNALRKQLSQLRNMQVCKQTILTENYFQICKLACHPHFSPPVMSTFLSARLCKLGPNININAPLYNTLNSIDQLYLLPSFALCFTVGGSPRLCASSRGKADFLEKN